MQRRKLNWSRMYCTMTYADHERGFFSIRHNDHWTSVECWKRPISFLDDKQILFLSAKTMGPDERLAKAMKFCESYVV